MPWSLDKLRRKWIDRVLRLTFGRDVFISYSREDGLEYAQRLGTLLTQDKGLSVYLDQWGSTAGKKLPLRLRLALRRSGLFVLVATPAALRSRYVRREVVKFSLTRRTILAIDVGAALTDALAAKTASRVLTHVIRRAEETKRVSSMPPRPSQAVLDAIDNAAAFMRQERRISATVATMLATVVIGLLAATVLSRLVIRDAREEAAAREAAAGLEVAEAGVKVLDAEKKEAKATLAADAADARALSAEGREADAREAVGAAREAESEARANAERQRAVARALRLADDSSTLMRNEPEQITRAALLAIESSKRLLANGVRSLQADTALRSVARLLPKVLYSAELHAGDGGDVFLSADGRIVAAYGEKGIEVVDVLRQKRIDVPAKDLSWGDFALSADGNRMAVVFRQRGTGPIVVRTYDTSNGAEVSAITDLPHGFRIGISPDGKWLVALYGTSVAVRNAQTGAPAPHTWQSADAETTVRDAVFSPDGRWLGIAAGKMLEVWDWNNDARIEIRTFERRVMAVAFTPDGGLIAANDDSSYGVWPIAAKATPVMIGDGRYPVLRPIIGKEQIAFSDDGRILVHSIPATKGTVYQLPCDGRVALDVYGTGMVIGCPDGSARRYELTGLQTRETARLQHGGSTPHVAASLMGFTSATRTSVKLWQVNRAEPAFASWRGDAGVAFSADGTRVAAIESPWRADGRVAVWRAGSYAEPQFLPVPNVGAAAFLRDGRIVAVTRDGDVGIAGEAGFVKLPVPRGAENMILAASRTRNVFAFTSAADVYVCEGSKITRLEHPEWVTSIDFADADVLVTGTQDGVVRRWEWRRDSEHPREWRHDDRVDAVVVTPDGRYIAAAGGQTLSSVVRIWDSRSPAPSALATLPHEARTSAAAFDPTGRYLATSTVNGTIRVWQRWETPVPELVATLLGHPSNTIAFSPDGRWLASDHSLTLTNWRQEELIDALCARLDHDRRGLTAEEWAAHLPDEPRRDTCVAATDKLQVPFP